MESFNSTEFADFWESHAAEKTLGITWMASQILTPEGRALVADAANILAERHGWSSDPVKSFRSAMRAASVKAGLSTPLTIKKRKGDDGPSMRVEEAATRSAATRKSGKDIAKDRMKKWLEAGVCDIADLHEAVSEIEMCE